MKFKSDPYENLTKSLQGVVSEAERILRRANDKRADRFADLRERLGDGADKVRRASHQAGEKAVFQARATDETIRAHPYESIALAVAAGFLLGYMITRR